MLLKYALFAFELLHFVAHLSALAGIRWVVRADLERKWWYFAAEIATSTAFLIFCCPPLMGPRLLVASHVLLHVVYTAPWLVDIRERPDYWKRIVDWGSVEFVGRHEGTLEWLVIWFDATCHFAMIGMFFY